MVAFAPRIEQPMASPRKERLLLIGLDCAEPSLVFDAWRDDLPNLRRLAERGAWGRMRTCDPPMAVPAWACMMSGRDPGELGIYGFCNRARHSYDAPAISTGLAVTEKRLWQILSAEGLRCAVVNVPGTYPPSPLNGVLVSCFLAPSNESQYTYPAELRDEIEGMAGGYVIDVRDFRTEDKGRLLRDIRAMTAKRFEVARRLLARERWDLFALVETGIDRVHHGFWRFFDREHRLYRPGNRFESAVHDHYVEVDAEIGRTLDAAGDVSVMVVSGHGARRLEGGVRINEWLRREGYLRLLEEPAGPVELEARMVDWSATRAWGDGGLCGRLYLNVEGREPAGCVRPAEYDALRDEIAAGLAGMEDDLDRPMGTAVHRPEDLYRTVRNVAPDLIVHFGGLAWRSVGTVGGGEVLTFEDDTGPAGANGAMDAVLIHAGSEVPPEARGREVKDATIYDVLPTLLGKFGIPGPAGLRGKPIF